MAFSDEDHAHFCAQITAGRTFGQIREAAEREARAVPSKATLSAIKKRLDAEKKAAASPPEAPRVPPPRRQRRDRGKNA